MLYKPLVLVGPMCSGKTALAKFLEGEGWQRVITYTTRPKREGEKQGVDYIFTTNDEFKLMIERGEVVEYTHYNATFGECYYGSTKLNYEPSERKKVIVLNPEGALNPYILDHTVQVYLDISFEICLDRARSRGDENIEIARRFDEDREKFHTYEQAAPWIFRIRGDHNVKDLASVMNEINLTL